MKPGSKAEWLKLMEDGIIPLQVQNGMVFVGSFVRDFKNGCLGSCLSLGQPLDGASLGLHLASRIRINLQNTGAPTETPTPNLLIRSSFNRKGKDK